MNNPVSLNQSFTGEAFNGEFYFCHHLDWVKVIEVNTYTKTTSPSTDSFYTLGFFRIIPDEEIFYLDEALSAHSSQLFSPKVAEQV